MLGKCLLALLIIVNIIILLTTIIKIIITFKYTIVVYCRRLRADALWPAGANLPLPQSWGAVFFPRPPRSRAYFVGRRR